MIVGVGSQRKIDWWVPLVAVAGARARSQAEAMLFGKDNLLAKLDITSAQFDRFMNGWAAPLSEIELDNGKPLRICNCRATEAKRSYDTNYAVMNLVDLLDIIYNIGQPEFFFEGAATSTYSGQGRAEKIMCHSCEGWFTGMVFDKMWDEKTEERKSPPILWLLNKSIPFTPFTGSWVYSQWSSEAEIYRAVGWGDELFRDTVSELTNKQIEENPLFGIDWEPTGGWKKEGLVNRFEQWLDAGADEKTAVMGLLLERVTHQSSFAPPPSSDAVLAIFDERRRDLLLKRVDMYATELKRKPLVGLEKATPFELIVRMAVNDVDPEFLDILRAGENF